MNHVAKFFLNVASLTEKVRKKKNLTRILTEKKPKEVKKFHNTGEKNRVIRRENRSIRKGQKSSFEHSSVNYYDPK